MITKFEHLLVANFNHADTDLELCIKITSECLR